MPLSIDLSISCCRVIFFAAFFFAGFAGSVVVASFEAAGGVVVAAAGGGVVVAAGGVAAGAVAAGAAGAVPAFGVVCASPMPAGKDTNANVAAIKEILWIKESFGMKTSNAAPGCDPISVSLWHCAMQAAFGGLFAAQCQFDANPMLCRMPLSRAPARVVDNPVASAPPA